MHPTKPKAVRNLNGDLCSTPAESLQRWQQHFNCVLNTSGVFSLDLVDSFPSCDVHDDLAVVPSLDEVRHALSLVAGNKASGRSGILIINITMVPNIKENLISLLMLASPFGCSYSRSFTAYLSHSSSSRTGMYLLHQSVSGVHTLL